MFCRIVAGAAAAALLGVAASTAVIAQGLADLHTHVRIGNRICMLDHFHTGTGSGNSKNAAMQSAIASWSGFTAWEYGANWGSWKLSESRHGNCEPGLGGGWTCTIHSRPCRPR
jgi:hypothetical protein